MKTFLHFLVIGLLNIFFFRAHSQQKPFCNENYRNSSNASSTTCDSSSLFNYYPYDSTEIKNYYLHFIVQTDSAGNPIGGITEADINFLMLNTNIILNPHMFDFCYHNVEFSESIEYPLPYEAIIQYVDIRDCPTLGLSGNPICLDFIVVADSALIGGKVLAHELAHNFGLAHSSDPNNLMYPSGGASIALDSSQIAIMHCKEDTVYYTGEWTNHPYFNYTVDFDFSDKVCNNPGKPYARFYTNNYGGCVPLQILFIDYTFFEPTKWLWAFGDGSFDTTANPIHTYAKAGIYNVTLIVSNSYGSDTLTKNNYITVIDSVYSLPIYEDFEDTSGSWFAPPKDWYIENPDYLYTYFATYSNGVPTQSGTTSIRIIDQGSSNINAPPTAGIENSLVTPPMDLRYVKNPYLTYNYAYPLIQDYLNGDKIYIYASTDCGNSFTEVYKKYEDLLAIGFKNDSTNILGTIFIPYDSVQYRYDNFYPYTSEAWKKDSINLSSLEGEDSVILKYTFLSNSLRYLYLDDILISADKISGLPVADFMADTTTIYKNDTIHFTNLSNKYSDTLQWFFTGATITTSNDTNPSIIYDSAGIFPVTLVAWNMFGRDTLTKLAYINVLQKIIDTIPCDSMKISLSKNDLSCKNKNDGTVTASAFNGNSDYTFSWSTGDTTNSISSLAAGTYTVTVTDSIGCIKTAYITITEPPILSSNLAYSNVSCLGGNDGNVVVSTYGGNGYYSYLWSTGDTINIISDLTTGTYTVTVTDSIGCTKTDSIKISYIDSLPAADFSYADTGNTVNFTNLSTNADSSLWNFGDDSTDNSANPTHMYSDYGTYEACLIALNICGADTLCKSISIIDGIKENTGKINLQIFPNPNSGTFTIIVEQPTASEISITLTNILGQKIYTNKAAAKVLKDELNLTNFSKGLYSMKIVTNNESVSRKVVYR